MRIFHKFSAQNFARSQHGIRSLFWDGVILGRQNIVISRKFAVNLISFYLFPFWGVLHLKQRSGTQIAASGRFSADYAKMIYVFYVITRRCGLRIMSIHYRKRELSPHRATRSVNGQRWGSVTATELKKYSSIIWNNIIQYRAVQ